MNKFFIDSDIFLDIFLERNFFGKSSALFYDLCAKSSDIEINTTSICISNIHYIYSKHVGSEVAKSKLAYYLTSFGVIPTSEHAVVKAIESSFNDFEDALQYYTCKENDIDLIITRNKKDYTLSSIPVVSPVEFLGN
jgi:predicted nucleic acid-binding protein